MTKDEMNELYRLLDKFSKSDAVEYKSALDKAVQLILLTIE